MTANETAAAYVRVSTRKQKKEYSHVRQRERIAKWAESNDLLVDGWDEYHTENRAGDIIDWEPISGELTGDIYWHEDIAISGQSDQRDGYDRMMSDLSPFDYVVVRELSRFGRDVAKVLNDILEIGDEEGVEFVSVTEPMLDTTSAHGKLMVNLIASINDFYAELRREQAQRMMERRKEKGLPVGRPRKLNEAQMEDVFDWRKKGLSYGSIATLVGEVHGVEIDSSTIYRYCDDHDVDSEEAEQAT